MTMELIRACLSLLVVIGLVAGLSWLLRRYGTAHLGRRGGRRLAVVEALALDARRRLVLIRRDQAEYLVLLSPQGDILLPAEAAAQAALSNSPPSPPSPAQPPDRPSPEDYAA